MENSSEYDENALLYCNRAFAYLKTEAFGLALEDARKSMKVDAKCVKAYYRAGSAYVALGKYKQASKHFERVLKLKPKDKDAKKKLNACLKEAKRKAFEDAIGRDDTQSAYDKIRVKEFGAPPAEYDGPNWDDDKANPPTNFASELLDFFKRDHNNRLPKKIAIKILLKTYEILRQTPSLVRVDDAPEKFTVCGDTHGQFYDLCNIFALNGGVPSADNPYLFNGDMCDRGSFSLEVVLTLFAFKCENPKSIVLLRGNHETKNMNKIYGMEAEVQTKLDAETFTLVSEVFQSLPLCAVLQNDVIVMHGGLFQDDDVTLDDIEAVSRFQEPPDSGIMSDILWSDPQPFEGRGPSKRGIGLSFGPDITKRFLEKNDLSLVIRSHEVRDEGWLLEHDGSLITVFSAPNYCDSVGNKGAVIIFSEPQEKGFAQRDVLVFEAVDHPKIPPMAYSLPGQGGFGF